MRINKNKILLSTYVISLLPKVFFDLKDEKEYRLGIFNDWSVTLDWYFTFYSAIIGFFIMAYCLHYPNGIDKHVSRLILIITILDLLHLVLFAMQGFGLVKIGTAIALTIGYEIYKKRHANT